MVIVRENTEGLYAGLELMILPGVAQSIKLTTEDASTRIAEFAFRYAELNSRPRVTIVHRANIMKISDGLALDCARRVGELHKGTELCEMIVDAAAMTMVRDPNRLGVLVTENLYGDILSDLGAGLVGGLGIIPGANIGDNAAVFRSGARLGARHRGQGLREPHGLDPERRDDAPPHRRAELGAADRDRDHRGLPRGQRAHARSRGHGVDR